MGRSKSFSDSLIGLVFCFVIPSACGGGGETDGTDGDSGVGGEDADVFDAGTQDAAGNDHVDPASDAWLPDAGMTDAARPDAGEDTGTDAGPIDAGADGGPDGGSAPRFGIIRGRGGAVTEDQMVAIFQDLGARWVRTNVKLDGKDIDLVPMLEAGLNLVLTISNEDKGNVVSCDCGSTQGCPYSEKAGYQDAVKAAIAPVVPYLAKGQRLMVQCENEVVPGGRYWCGSDDQYLNQLSALHEAVKSVDPAIAVVMTSLASGTLDVLVDPADPQHATAELYADKLMTQGAYDAIDLHFYGCVEDIPKKIAWAAGRFGVGKIWISTENGGPDPRCNSPSDPDDPYSYTKDPAEYKTRQAEQVESRLLACADGGGSVCLWFSLFDTLNEEAVFAHMGLIEAVPPYDHKPAYDAFKQFASMHR